MSFCTSCGTKIESEWNLCPNCGKSITPNEQTSPMPSHPVAHGLTCRTCGNPVGKDQVICMNCGVQLKRVKSKSFINSAAKCYCFMVIIGIIIAVISLLLFIPSFFP